MKHNIVNNTQSKNNEHHVISINRNLLLTGARMNLTHIPNNNGCMDTECHLLDTFGTLKVNNFALNKN